MYRINTLANYYDTGQVVVDADGARVTIPEGLEAMGGDTGWVPATLEAGWTGSVYLRRMGNRVRALFDAVATANAAPSMILRLPVGWRADTPAGISERFLLHNTASAGRRGYVSYDGVSITNYTASEALYGATEWLTSDPMPA